MFWLMSKDVLAYEEGCIWLINIQFGLSMLELCKLIQKCLLYSDFKGVIIPLTK